MPSAPTRPVRTTRHSENNEWATPRWLFEALAERIPFTVDAFATADNALVPRFGVWAVGRGDIVWANPPYGHGLGGYVAWAAQRAGGERCVVCLLPVRTSTGWWHMALQTARQLVFVRGRLRFSGQPVNAPFDSAVVVFGEATRIRCITALRGQERVEWVA